VRTLALLVGTAVLVGGPVAPGGAGRSTPARPSGRVLGLAGAALAVVAGAAVGSPLLAGPGALAVAVTGAAVEPFRAQRRAQRRRADVTALVDALARGVRSGATLTGAFHDARSDGTAPALADELDALAARVAAGRPFAEAVDEWAVRADDPGLRLLAGTVSVLAHSGGPAAPALDAAARTVRDRHRAEAELRAQSAQAVASAVVLVVAPAIVAVVLAALDPRLGRFLTTHPLGAACVTVALALDALALWWMHRLVRAAAP
jgi:tight adherence protein B